MRYRLGYFIESFYPRFGGAEKRAQSLLSRLESFDVHVYTINFGAEQEQKIGKINIHRILGADKDKYFKQNGRDLITTFKYAERVKAIVKDQEFDVYVFDQFPYYHFSRSLKLIMNKPKIVQVHEILKNYYNSFVKEKMLEHYESQMFKNADMNIVTNDVNRLFLSNAYSIPDDRIAVIQNGVDMIKKPAMKGKNIVCVGRNTKDKNIAQVIELAKILKDYKFTIVSNHDHVTAENVEIKSGLSNEEIYREYENAFAFISTSRREGFSIAALEALGFGVPAVYLKTPFNKPMESIIKDGITGYGCNSIAEMADKINFLHSHDHEWDLLSQNAYELAKNYTWDQLAKQYEKLLLAGVKR